ncbi:hypothetical protein ACFL6S_04730 [Candidatus Poribacteria bacterium]
MLNQRMIELTEWIEETGSGKPVIWLYWWLYYTGAIYHWRERRKPVVMQEGWSANSGIETGGPSASPGKSDTWVWEVVSYGAT